MDELDAVIAQRLAEVLEDEGLRREDVAQAMTRLGFRWTGNRVTQVVTRRRSLSLLELAGLCCALRRPVDDFLSGTDAIPLPAGGSVEVEDVRQALAHGAWVWASKAETYSRVRSAYADYMEASIKAARRLGVSPETVDAASRELWGHVLGQERDRRVGRADGESRRTLQARRGHVTRELMSELSEHLRRGDER